jgi:hypothetical protein
MPLPIVAIHGVCGTLAEVTGYGAKLAGAIDVSLGTLTPGRPRVIEALWADVIQGVVSRAEIERATAALALALGGPVAAGAVLLLQGLGFSPLSTAVDYAIDALLYERAAVRAEIKNRVRHIISRHAPCVVYAHSLGSVIAVDVLTDFAREGLLQGPRSGWPVRALVTVGSPLGIDVPLVPGNAYRDRAPLLARQVVGDRMPWANYIDPDDPVADGSLWGDAPRDTLSRFPGYRGFGATDALLGTGGVLASHVSYWGHPFPAQYAAAHCF